MAINRLSSSIHRNRGRFWLQDRTFDAAICLELMDQLEPPELANKLASRAAHLLATETNKRIEVYGQVHVFYEARSNIAHGDKGKRKGKGKEYNGLQEGRRLGFGPRNRFAQCIAGKWQVSKLEGADSFAV